MLAYILASLLVGWSSMLCLILCVAELRWRDPKFRGLHRRLW